MPRVTLHYAQTLDGRIATRTGHSRWISGPASLRLAHQLRAANDAVLVGVGTVLADDPRLTVRLAVGRSPLRVVADSTVRLPLDAQLLVDGAAKTLVATTLRAPKERVEAVRARGAEVLVIDADGDGRLDLEGLLRALEARGVGSLLVEGGQELITAMLARGLVDDLVLCIAPKLVGAGIEAVGDLGIRHMDHALELTRLNVRRLDEDIIVEGRLQRRPAPDQ